MLFYEDQVRKHHDFDFLGVRLGPRARRPWLIWLPTTASHQVSSGLLYETYNTDQDYVRDLGVRVHAYAPAKNVLDAQADLGFAFVTEDACEALLASKGKELPEGGEDDTHRKTSLALACLSAIKPGLDTRQASKVINKAFLAENPDCYADLTVNEDALTDVLNKGEARKVSEYIVQVEKVKATKAVAMQTREQYVGKYFKKTPAPKYTPSQKKQPRWLPVQDKAATSVITEWIEKHMPPDVQVQCDDYNGRWRVIAPTLDWKSVSWSKRGYEKASLEVIHQGWLYQRDWDGACAPFSMDELSQRFQEGE